MRITRDNTAADIDALTHDGIFHADEVTAVAILDLAIRYDTLLLRTRDKGAISRMEGLADIIDVGGKFDPANRLFDHHMITGGPDPRANGVPYASAGLLWHNRSIPAIQAVAGSQSLDVIAAVHARIDQEFIIPIDAADTGVITGSATLRGSNGQVRIPSLSLSRLIAGMNGRLGEPGSDENFLAAVELMKGFLSDAIRQAVQDHLDEDAVKQAALASEDKIVILDKYVACAGDLLNRISDALYVVHPDSHNGWRVLQVPEKPGSFQGRKPLPEPWAAKNGEDLDKVTGVPGGIFCHPNRFIAGHQTREGAIELAKAAVAS